MRGNVIHGFDNYARKTNNPIRRKYQERDRIFSLSSVTACKSTPLNDAGGPIVVPENVAKKAKKEKK